jgi:hypothetical protein
MMKSKLSGLVALLLGATPSWVLASSILSPWGMMNELGPWDSSDVETPADRARKIQEQYPRPPRRTARQLRMFSRPANHASVDIDILLPKAPVYVRRGKGVSPYSVGLRVLTPEYRSMSLAFAPAKGSSTTGRPPFEMTCEIESIRRWDRNRMHGWNVRMAATFNDEGTVKRLEKAVTVISSHGVCYPSPQHPGPLKTKGAYEFHAAFVSRFEDSDKAAVMVEIGTDMHFNTAGNGYFQRPHVDIAFTALGNRDEIRIKYR